MRTLTVPLREKPGSLDAEVLKSKAAAARRFLEDTARSAPAFDFEAFREHGRLVEEERAEIERTVLKVGTRTRTRTCTRTRQPSSNHPTHVVVAPSASAFDMEPPDTCGRRTQYMHVGYRALGDGAVQPSHGGVHPTPGGGGPARVHLTRRGAAPHHGPSRGAQLGAPHLGVVHLVVHRVPAPVG